LLVDTFPALKSANDEVATLPVD